MPAQISVEFFVDRFALYYNDLKLKNNRMDDPQNVSEKNEATHEILLRFTRDRSNLLAVLYKIQEKENEITEEDVSEIALYLNLSKNDIYSVASFYPRFKLNNLI